MKSETKKRLLQFWILKVLVILSMFGAILTIVFPENWIGPLIVLIGSVASGLAILFWVLNNNWRGPSI